MIKSCENILMKVFRLYCLILRHFYVAVCAKLTHDYFSIHHWKYNGGKIKCWVRNIDRRFERFSKLDQRFDLKLSNLKMGIWWKIFSNKNLSDLAVLSNYISCTISWLRHVLRNLAKNADLTHPYSQFKLNKRLSSSFVYIFKFDGSFEGQSVTSNPALITWPLADHMTTWSNKLVLRK